MTESTPLANVMVTLGARDLPSLRDFYCRAGWPQIIDTDDFAAFEITWADMPDNPIIARRVTVT